MAPSNRPVLLLCALGLALALAGPSGAHGTFHGRLARLDQQLERAPKDVDLWLARAALHREHRDFDAALSDLERAAALDPARAELDYHRARVTLAAGQPAAAEAALTRFLERRPGHAAGCALRARARTDLGRPLAAAADWTCAIEAHPAAPPDYYVARASALAAAGDAHLVAALEGLEAGLARFGEVPVPTLALQAAEIEVRLGRTAAALARIDRLASRAERKESWYARRGRILERAGRRGEAQAAFEQARAALGTLPEHRRATPAMRELDAEVAAAIERLAAEDRS